MTRRTPVHGPPAATLPVPADLLADGWTTPRHAAARLHITRQRIYQLLQNGKLAGLQTPLGWLLTTASVEAHAAWRTSFGMVQGPRARAVCRYGHPMPPEDPSTWYAVKGGGRRCKQCTRERNKVWRLAHKERVREIDRRAYRKRTRPAAGLLSCSCCGAGVYDTPEDNVSYGKVPYPHDTGFGECRECGGDPSAKDIRKRLGWGACCFVDARIPIIARALTGDRKDLFEAMSYAKQVGIVYGFVSKGVLV